MQFAFSRGDIPSFLYLLMFPLEEVSGQWHHLLDHTELASGVPGSGAEQLWAGLRLCVPRDSREHSVACPFSRSEGHFFTPARTVPELRR